MRVACSKCQNQIQIDDAKVPTGTFKIKCPKCGTIQTLQGAGAPPPPSSGSEPELASGNDLEVSPDVDAFVRREIAAARKEIISGLRSSLGIEGKWEEEDSDTAATEIGGKRALICEDDQVYIDILSATLRKMGYHLDVARSTAEAIKKVESGFYTLVTVDYAFPDDKEGGNKIISKINGQKGVQRRQTFVVLISANIKSADANAAFFHGANITVNKEEIKNLEAHIREGQRHFQQLYSIFNRILDDKNERM
jgi:predicted Zn finger-like uncharacterized protein